MDESDSDHKLEVTLSVFVRPGLPSLRDFWNVFDYVLYTCSFFLVLLKILTLCLSNKHILLKYSLSPWLIVWFSHHLNKMYIRWKKCSVGGLNKNAVWKLFSVFLSIAEFQEPYAVAVLLEKDLIVVDLTQTK